MGARPLWEILDPPLPCDITKAIYPTWATLLLPEILFSVFFAKILSLVLSAKILF